MLGAPSDSRYAGEVIANRIKVEKLGGFAGFGGSSHLRSEGEIDPAQLPAGDRSLLEQLLASPHAPAAAPSTSDAFRYRLSWIENGQERSVEIDGDELPESVKAVAKDSLV